MKFFSGRDAFESSSVTLQTKAKKAYPDPDPPAFATIDPHAADGAVEQTRSDQDTACREELIRSAPEARSVQIRGQFIKNMPRWLRARATRKVYSGGLLFFLRENNCHLVIFAKQAILSWTYLAKRDLRLHIHLLPL